MATSTMRVAAAAAFLALLGLTGCDAGVTGGGASPTGASPTGASPTGASPTGSAGTGEVPGSEDCFVGEYQVGTITGRDSVDVNGQQATVSGAVSGLRLSVTRAGAWTLTGSDGRAVFTVAGYQVTGTINGQSHGTFARDGSRYTFQQSGATGTVVLSLPSLGEQRVPMETVGPALAPTGTATVTCAGDRVTLDSASVKVELTRTGSAGGGGAPAPTASTGGGSGGTGGPLVFDDSARQEIIACGNRVVVVNGSANRLTFTGTCASLTVNGSASVIEVGTVGVITVNGHGDLVVYGGGPAGKPTINDNGAGNQIEPR